MDTEAMVNQTFGRWTVLGEAERYPASGQRRLRCQCHCGVVKVVAASSLRSGKSNSCGCLQRELKSAWHAGQPYTHNRLDPLYQTYSGIKGRCLSVTNAQYKNYGNRGIQLYAPWVDDFPAFRDWVMSNLGERPEGQTLDRIDNDGHYAPGNLRWATWTQQAANRRTACSLQSQLDAMRNDRDLWRERALTCGYTVR